MGMQPKNHILTSGAAVLALALYIGLPIRETAIWTAAACIATVALDLDHFILQLLMPDRRHIIIDVLTHPLRHLDMDKLARTLHYDGFGILRAKWHFAETAAATAALFLLGFPFATPIAVSLWVHTLMDLGHLVVYPQCR
jgi:hypothetical protein